MVNASCTSHMMYLLFISHPRTTLSACKMSDGTSLLIFVLLLLLLLSLFMRAVSGCTLLASTAALPLRCGSLAIDPHAWQGSALPQLRCCLLRGWQ